MQLKVFGSAMVLVGLFGLFLAAVSWFGHEVAHFNGAPGPIEEKWYLYGPEVLSRLPLVASLPIGIAILVFDSRRIRGIVK